MKNSDQDQILNHFEKFLKLSLKKVKREEELPEVLNFLENAKKSVEEKKIKNQSFASFGYLNKALENNGDDESIISEFNYGTNQYLVPKIENLLTDCTIVLKKNNKIFNKYLV